MFSLNDKLENAHICFGTEAYAEYMSTNNEMQHTLEFRELLASYGETNIQSQKLRILDFFLGPCFVLYRLLLSSRSFY